MKKNLPDILCLLASCVLMAGCSSGETKSEATLFQLLSPEETGVHFTNQLNDDPLGTRNILSFPYYYNGAGVTVGDINNDGLPDIFFAANEGPNRLYLNKGNFRFEDITESSGVNPPNKHWSTGAVMADVNGDGWLDIYICQGGYAILPDPEQRENLLLINNQDGTFSERAAEYGIHDSNESVSAAFFDYDRDGDLDLYVLNESKYAMVLLETVYNDLKDKRNLEAASGNLYRNDGGKFTKVTEQAGLLRYGYGLGLVVSDIDGDGWTDIYVANDYSVPDFMFINNGDGTFTDRIKEKTRQVPFFAMGCDIADFNNDGLVDIAVLDMATTDHVRDKTLMASMDVEGFWFFINQKGYQYQYMFNSFQINNGNGTFSNIAALSGLLRSDWSWSALLADFDNDGYKDYFVTNGFKRYSRDNDFRNQLVKAQEQNGGRIPEEMKKELYAKMPEIKDPNFIYRNNRDLTFTQVSEAWGLEHPSFSNGCVYADLDGDGDLDLVVNNVDDKAFIYKNLASEQKRGHFIQFRFEGAQGVASIYNTKVSIYYGDEIQYQEFHPTRGYASSMDHMLHFGVGSAQRIDRVVVEWLDGSVQELTDIPVGQVVTLRQAAAARRSAVAAPVSLAFEELSPGSIGIDFVHRENTYNDFAAEILLPHKQSALGPGIAVGDVNGDGLEDFYIGGASGQTGVLYVQLPDGRFKATENRPFGMDTPSEDMGAAFFDADGDGDLDLYVVSGGGGDFAADSPLLQDRLYINNYNSGSFMKVRAMPDMPSSGNVVRTFDFDGDGDLDIFVGGAAVPGKYPYPTRSYLLRNDNKRFTDVTADMAPDLVQPGIVKDAVWADLDGNGLPDLVVVGEWMPVRIFLNEAGKFREASEQYGTDKLKGWWYSVAASDLDGDGRPDLVLGNIGLNTKFFASEKKPFNVFADDFDGNGSCDIVLSKEYKGKLVPSRGRQCSSEQMPFIKSKFPTYKEFAVAELKDILGQDKLSKSLHLQATTFASTVLLNRGGKFEKKQLPNLAQISPVNRIIVEDLNGDGHADLVIAGNMHDTEVETPRYDAGNGLILLGNGRGDFQVVPGYKTGLFASGNVKDMALIRKVAGGGVLLLVAVNNGPVKVFRLKISSSFEVKQVL